MAPCAPRAGSKAALTQAARKPKQPTGMRTAAHPKTTASSWLGEQEDSRKRGEEREKEENWPDHSWGRLDKLLGPIFRICPIYPLSCVSCIKQKPLRGLILLLCPVSPHHAAPVTTNVLETVTEK